MAQNEPEQSEDSEKTGGLDPQRLLGLFAQHNLELRAYARVILPSTDFIDDVMQEASLVVWNKRDRLRDEDGFLPWVKVIVRNISFRYRRKLICDRHIFDDELVARILDEPEEDEDATTSQRFRALLRCLDRLPPERKALVLTPYQGHGAVKALAEKKGRSANSISLVLARIRARLMRCVEDELALRKSSL
jgi:RNA polymerase sigma-70 factor, ECF subfamily